MSEIEDNFDDEDWARLTLDQFLAGYAESDAIYDEMPEG
jgi:hypothetical protein